MKRDVQIVFQPIWTILCPNFPTPPSGKTLDDCIELLRKELFYRKNGLEVLYVFIIVANVLICVCAQEFNLLHEDTGAGNDEDAVAEQDELIVHSESSTTSTMTPVTMKPAELCSTSSATIKQLLIHDPNFEDTGGKSILHVNVLCYNLPYVFLFL